MPVKKVFNLISLIIIFVSVKVLYNSYTIVNEGLWECNHPEPETVYVP